MKHHTAPQSRMDNNRMDKDNSRMDNNRMDKDNSRMGNNRMDGDNSRMGNNSTGYRDADTDNTGHDKRVFNRKLSRWIRILFAGYFEILLALPVLWLIPIYLVDDRVFWPWLALLVVCYLISYGLRKLKPMSRLLTRHVVFLALAFAYSWLMLDGWAAITIGLLVAWLACIRGSTYAMYEFRDVLSTNICLIGIVLYFLVAFVAQYSPDLNPISVPLSWTGLVYLIIALFVINRNALDKESMQNDKDKSVGKSLVWKNRFLLIGFAVVVGLIAAFDIIREAISSVFQAIGKWIAWLLSLGTDGEEMPLDNPPALSPQEMLPMEPSEPSLFWTVLETIAKWFVFILLIVAVIYAIYRLARILPRLFKSIYERLMARFQLGEMSESDRGYEDEVERLSDWEDLRKRWGDRIKSMFEREQRESWKNLKNNTDRIRYLYRETVSRLVQEGYTYRSSLTPRETKADATQWKSKRTGSPGSVPNTTQTSSEIDLLRDELPDELVRYYENVRYHNNVPNDHEVEALKNRLENKSVNRKREQ